MSLSCPLVIWSTKTHLNTRCNKGQTCLTIPSEYKLQGRRAANNVLSAEVVSTPRVHTKLALLYIALLKKQLMWKCLWNDHSFLSFASCQHYTSQYGGKKKVTYSSLVVNCRRFTWVTHFYVSVPGFCASSSGQVILQWQILHTHIHKPILTYSWTW